MRRATALIAVSLCLLPIIAAARCEEWCSAPCAELNGDVQYECGGCGNGFTCRPGAPGFPGTDTVSVDASGSTSNTAADYDPARCDEMVASGQCDDPESKAFLDRHCAGLCPAPRPKPDPFEHDVSGISCLPYLRSLGTLKLCPVFNGIWTSFLDHTRWGEYQSPLQPAAAVRIVSEMALYDNVGLSTWIGEDFDERVLSALELHSSQHRGEEEGATEAAAKPPLLPYSIIVESGHDVLANLRRLRERLGPSATRWVQLGPPALSHLEEYRKAFASGMVEYYGVEDFGADMIEAVCIACVYTCTHTHS